ncbi:MAG: sulfotransferase [Chloroflexota bacterium]|nr:sulfotransferase [Chloroflexota bacterium]
MPQPQAGEPPIFIVGLPRSGTTLLASMLAIHPAIDCGPETFFFARLPPDPSRLLDPAGWPERALDYVCGLRLRDAPVHESFGRTRQDVRAFLSARPPSLATMLESLTAARAQAQGKRRWAEKTPRHLGRLALIRRTYPAAAVIRVVRDPRDAAMSMTRLPFASDSLLANLYLCARAEAAATPALERDPRLLTVRYEDLVTGPERELLRVVRFVGESFDPRMLDPQRAPPELAAAHEWWKGKESQPLDLSRVAAWRREMSEQDQRIAAVVCHEMIRRHGYEGAVSPRRSVTIAPDVNLFVAQQENLARALALDGIVVLPLGRERDRTRDGRSDVAFWPLAGGDPWALGGSVGARTRALARMGVSLGRRRLAGRSAAWVRPPRVSVAKRGLATSVAEQLLRALARPTSLYAWLDTLGVTQRPDVTPLTRRPEPDLR